MGFFSRVRNKIGHFKSRRRAIKRYESKSKKRFTGSRF